MLKLDCFEELERHDIIESSNEEQRVQLCCKPDMLA